VLCIEMVPDEIQQEMKNIYCALCELLRHFWACFPTTTKALEDKVLFVVLCTDNLLSVQCYAWTENKFTCVSVCPSHFLLTRLQIRPLNRFLQLMALCKDVPFGGLDDHI